jgi:ribonuclease R
LAEICTLSISGINKDGELLAAPLEWKSKKILPQIIVLESGRGKAAIIGDRILAKLRQIAPHTYQASIIRILQSEVAQNIIGVFIPTSVNAGNSGGIIEPISRKNKESFMVLANDSAGAQRGELVVGETLPNMPSMGMSYAKITERLGLMDAPKVASLIAATIHNLPSLFSAEAIAEAEAAPLPLLTKNREDLRDIPLLTIDGEDAMDFDDAVFAEPDGDGFHIVVAIAEVAFYVADGSALDIAAFERGNSVYFPDRVIPMLPERLSNGLCSLNPNEDRLCLAVHIWIDRHGAMHEYKFMRGIMRSVARLTYQQVEEMEHNPLIKNLNLAYAALAYERDHRGALDLDLPEYKICFDNIGNVAFEVIMF